MCQPRRRPSGRGHEGSRCAAPGSLQGCGPSSPRVHKLVLRAPPPPLPRGCCALHRPRWTSPVAPLFRAGSPRPLAPEAPTSTPPRTWAGHWWQEACPRCPRRSSLPFPRKTGPSWGPGACAALSFPVLSALSPAGNSDRSIFPWPIVFTICRVTAASGPAVRLLWLLSKHGHRLGTENDGRTDSLLFRNSQGPANRWEHPKPLTSCRGREL